MREDNYYSSGTGAGSKGKSMTAYKNESKKVYFDSYEDGAAKGALFNLQDIENKYRKVTGSKQSGQNLKDTKNITAQLEFT